MELTVNTPNFKALSSLDLCLYVWKIVLEIDEDYKPKITLEIGIKVSDVKILTDNNWKIEV